MDTNSIENNCSNQSKLDIVALVISIIALCTCSSCIIGAVVGIVLSIIVIRDNTGRFVNKTKAYIGLGLSVLSIIAFFVLMTIILHSMPDVKNQPLDVARQKVLDTRKGIEIKEEYEFSDEVEKGYVIKTNPESSKLLSKNDIVTLYVSRGKAVIIPDCINKDKNDVVTELNNLGLVVNETDEFSDDIEKGNVISTTPSCNEEVELGTTVDIVVSSGSRYKEIPSYENMTHEEYAKVLHELGIEFSVNYDFSDDIEKGYIMGCSSNIGDLVDVYDSITITVSKGPGVIVPELIGRNINTVLSELDTLGIGYNTVDEFSEESIGNIIKSDVASGDRVDESTIINLTVSKGTEEQAFKNECVSVTYDDLIRNPEKYKETKIKLKVHVKNIENDTLLGFKYGETVYATYEGKEIVINDGRETQEPKLRSGDNVTIYGYGDGNGTINVKQKEYQGSLVFGFSYNKTVDSYDIPEVKAEYIDF